MADLIIIIIKAVSLGLSWYGKTVMQKCVRIVLSIFILCFLGLQKRINAQHAGNFGPDEKITMRAPIIAQDKSEYFSLNDQIADIIIQATEELYLDDVVVCIMADSLSPEQDPAIAQQIIFRLNDLTAYREAIVIAETDLAQQIVPVERDNRLTLKDLIFAKSNKNDEGSYSNDIKTDLSMYGYFFDIETGALQGPFHLEVTEYGGNNEKSKKEALKTFKQRAILELKRIYWLAADVVSTTSGTISVPMGKNRGIKNGMDFEVITPDCVMGEGEDERMVPARVVGSASVVKVSDDSSYLHFSRQWQDPEPGSWIVEQSSALFAVQMTVVPPGLGNYSNYAIQVHARPMARFDGGAGFSIMRVTDSAHHDDYGFGFSGFALWRFVNGSRIRLGSQTGFDFDIPFRRDNDDNVVSALLFSMYLGMTTEIVLSPKADVVFMAGYRHGFRASKWEYTQDEENYPAFWRDRAPSLNNSGFMLSVGYKYYF